MMISSSFNDNPPIKTHNMVVADINEHVVRFLMDGEMMDLPPSLEEAFVIERGKILHWILLEWEEVPKT